MFVTSSTSWYGNWDQLWPDRLLGPYAELSLHRIYMYRSDFQ